MREDQDEAYQKYLRSFEPCLRWPHGHPTAADRMFYTGFPLFWAVGLYNARSAAEALACLFLWLFGSLAAIAAWVQ